MPDKEIPRKVKEIIKDIQKCYCEKRSALINNDLSCLSVTWLGNNDYRFIIHYLSFNDENRSWDIEGYVSNDFIITDYDDIESAVKAIANQYYGTTYTKEHVSEIDDAVYNEMEVIGTKIMHCNNCHECPNITSYYNPDLLKLIFKCPICGLTKKNEYPVYSKYDVHFAFEKSLLEWNETIRNQIDDIKTATNAVNHQDHSTHGEIECIDAVKSSMSIDGFRDYCRGNVLKYIWRYRDKNDIEDLKKAQWYLNKLISTFEGGEK